MKFFGLLKEILINKAGNTTLLVPVIISVIMGTTVATTDVLPDIMKEVRDTNRSANTYQVSIALAQYYDDNQHYPIILSTTNSWSQLGDYLVPEYVQEMPVDPSQSDDLAYTYSSDGQKAIVYYFSEVEDKQKEHWSY